MERSNGEAPRIGEEAERTSTKSEQEPLWFTKETRRTKGKALTPQFEQFQWDLNHRGHCSIPSLQVMRVGLVAQVNKQYLKIASALVG